MIPAVTLTKEHELTGVGVVQRTMGARKVFFELVQINTEENRTFS